MGDVAVRRINGRWAPGESGNPGGRPALSPAQRRAQRLLAKGSVAAAKTLLGLLDSEDERMRLAAAQAVLSRLPMAEVESEQAPEGTLAEHLVWLAERVKAQGGSGA